MPHPPNPSDAPTATYATGLDLVAAELQRFRLEQIRLGTWDTHAVVLIADHGLRPRTDFPWTAVEPIDGGQWVPFLCRTPNGGPAITIPPVRLGEIRTLLADLVTGRARSNTDVKAWASHQEESDKEGRYTEPPSRN